MSRSEGVHANIAGEAIVRPSRRGASRSRRVFIETHGCQMNAHDSEKAVSLLEELGFSETDDPSEADLILLNTCSVREKASEKLFHRVDALRRIGARSPVLGVLGCVAQAEAEAIFDRAPSVRLLVGPQALQNLPELVRQLDAGFAKAIDLRQENQPDFVEVGPEARRSGVIAFVTIIEGCNKNCSYCIVPFTRGRERSRPVQRIIDEVQGLAKAGYKEVHLLGQNVNSYTSAVTRPSGRQGEVKSFATLLARLAREGGVPRIKYTTSHPRDFSNNIVSVMDDHEALCPWIHLPVQSGSNAVLRRMYRGYTREHYLRTVEHIRRARRDFSITSDIIVGFPGETDQNFEETLDLVRRVEFDGLYTFFYSPRPHTPATCWEDNVPTEVKRERFKRLIDVQAEIQYRRYERYLGRIVDVLVEGDATRRPGDVTGHTTCNKVVNFPAYGRSLVGTIVPVLITQVKAHSLYGEII